MQNFIGLDRIRANNEASEKHHELLKNEEIKEIKEEIKDEINENIKEEINENIKDKDEQNYIVNEIMNNSTSHICNNDIDDKHKLKHLKTKYTSDHNIPIYSFNYLGNKSLSKEVLNNDESNTKNLEEAVNRRRKIKEIISAYSSLNLSLSSCNLDNLGNHKKISLPHFDYSGGDEEEKFQNILKINASEQNSSDKFNKNQSKKENNYISNPNLEYKNNALSSCNNYSKNECNNDNIKSKINQSIVDKSFIDKDEDKDDDDEIDDYKTLLTLDSNQTIFKKKPLKLPDISFLNSSRMNYSITYNNYNNKNNDNNINNNDINTVTANNNNDPNNNNNEFLRKKIIYEKLDFSSSCYDDNKDTSFFYHCNDANCTIQKKTGINKFTKKFVDNKINFYELKKENKNNIVKNYIKINKVENSNIEQLINNNMNNSNNYVDNNIKSNLQKYLKENNYENKILSKNTFDNSYFKYYTLSNCRKNNDINNIIHRSTVKSKNEKNTNFIDEINNRSIMYPSEFKYSKMHENINKKEHNIYSTSKYVNKDDEHLNNKVKSSLEEKEYLNSPYFKNIEKFKELLVNATRDNLNEYVKCIENVNNKKLKNYKYYVKQVNNYNISQYLNATFKASIPQKYIKESILNNSDTFSSVEKCVNESDYLSTTTYSDNSSISNFTNKSLINSNNNHNNLSLNFLKNKKKYHLKRTSTLSTNPTSEINSCSEKIENKLSLSLVNKNRKKLYDISSYCSVNNVKSKLQTSKINKTDFPNIKDNNFHNLIRLDNVHKNKIEKEKDLDLNDSFKNNYIQQILKKKFLYEPLEKNVYNSDYAKNYKNYDKSSFKEDEFTYYLKKKKKKNRSKNLYNSKNKNKNYFPFNTDSENYNDLNGSSISMLQSNSCENNHKELLFNDELNKLSNQTNKNKSIRYVNYDNNNDNIKCKKYNCIEIEKYLGQSINNYTNNSISKNVLYNINQDNVDEKNICELGNIRTNEIINVNNSYKNNKININNENFSCVNFLKNKSLINIHENISNNIKQESNNIMYPQNNGVNGLEKNDADESNVNNNYINEKRILCSIKNNSEDFARCDEKGIKNDSITKENKDSSYKNYNLIKNNNLFYFNNKNDTSKINEKEGKNENALLNNLKRENFNNPILVNKKEKDNESIDVLNCNFQISPNNNENFSKNKIEFPTSIQEYNYNNGQYPEHVNKGERKDIREIIKHNKTRIENLYDNEENQSDPYLSENASEFKSHTNENIEDNKSFCFSLKKFDYLYKSIKENSYSTNSFNDDIENKSVIKCSLDSFNEEFNNPISAPTPAASSFSNISLSSSHNKNLNKWNLFNLKNNQTNNIYEVHNYSNDQRNYVITDKFKNYNLYNNINNDCKSSYDKSNIDNKNYNNSNERDININSVNEKNKNNICESYSHEHNNNKGENYYFDNNSVIKKYEESNASINVLRNNSIHTKQNADSIINKKKSDNSQILMNGKYVHLNVFKDNANKKNVFDTLSDSSVNNRKSVNSIITNNINNLDKNLIHNNENEIIQKSLYNEIYKDSYSFTKNDNSSETLRNNLINLTENSWNYKKANKNNVNKIINTLEIKEIKINTKQGIFEITSSGEVIFTFLGRSEIRGYKNIKKKNINIDISKPRKLLFIIEMNGINIKIKDVLMNEILDYYNIFEEGLPKKHIARYKYAYDVVETLKKHTPKVSLTKKLFGIYNLMSNGSTPDFIAILNNNIFIEKVEIKNNHATFILKDKTNITIHNDDLNGITRKFTKKTIEQKEDSVIDSKLNDNYLMEMKKDNEDIKIVLMNLQKLLKKTGISIDIIIQNWCNTLHAYSHCLSLLTKGNAEYTLKLKKTLADITEKTEIHKRNIYFSIFPIIIEE